MEDLLTDLDPTTWSVPNDFPAAPTPLGMLAVIEDNLNTMPRKLHHWDSPHSVYAALTCNHR